jgi:formylglycine-generating enzyme required for sulfatase activity
VAGGSYQRTGSKSAATISDLCVDTLETTVAAYNECVTAGKCTTVGLDCSAQATWAKAGKEQQPVVCIDYDQANAYCDYRGKRLPTLEEWEWVARSGDEARTYTWGNEAPSDQLCWTGKQRQTESCNVGTHPADKTATGALDMAGNVLEFVTTERDAKSPVRIAKGGAWNGGDAALFTNGRLGGFRKEYRCGFLGVRCVAPRASAPGAQ